MPTLRELQTRVLGAVLDGEDAAELIRAGGLTPSSERLEVYANNARINFTESLRLGYPVLLRLVGEAYFDQCARAYRMQCPSRSGDLHSAGAAFAAYLGELHTGGEHRYLADVAHLEWLCQESLMAAEHGRLDLARLAEVAPARYESLRFKLHPAARLFASDYPAREIWEANLATETAPPLIDLAKGGERLLLMRRGGRLEFHRLSPGEHAFLESLAAHAAFAAAVETGAAAADAAAAFDAAAVLRRFVAAEAIVDFS